MITDEQAEKLHLAIDGAQGYANCEYVTTGYRPGCVIGQLAYIEGASLDMLLGWDEQADCLVEEVVGNGYDGCQVLEGYDMGLLDALQGAWDGRTAQGTEDIVRRHMHELVDTWNTKPL